MTQVSAAWHGENRPPDRSAIWRETLAALCATLVGIGLARFAYTPLIPALVAEGWFAPSAAAYLGAANLMGYLAGALAARRAAARISPVGVLRAMLLLATLSFFACALPLSFAWFFLWRFAAGVAGGALMVLAAPLVLPRVPAARRGLAGGIIFSGVGLGIVASGTLVPLLMRQGLVATWCGLGWVALLLSLVAWGGWPAPATVPGSPGATIGGALAPPGAMRTGVALGTLCAVYALNAVGLVPHMVFLVDFVARGLGRGLAAGAVVWVWFGLGALLGPVLAGHLADRAGFAAALRLALAVEASAVALPLLGDGAGLVLSSLVVGAFVPGIVPIVLGRVHELVAPGSARQGAWSLATAAFALGQAAAAYGFSFLFAWRADYRLLFGLGAAALLLALALDLGVARRGTRRGTAQGVSGGAGRGTLH